MKSWRVNLILFLFIVFGSAVIGRLFFVQVLTSDFYKALAKGLTFVSGKEGSRGEIFFAKGEPLAINMEWPLVFASVPGIKDKEKTAEQLSSVLSVEKAQILAQLEGESQYVPLKKRLAEKEAKAVKELNLAGIYLDAESGRYYPQEELASKVAGFLDNDKTGEYGLEGYYDGILKSKNEKGGKDLILGIDYSIQFAAENLLKRAKNDFDIEAGEIIVMDPGSGKILAMASFPNFNPNLYSKIKDFGVFQNSALQKLFEPGSIFKPFTMALALQEQKITPQTTYTDSGFVKIKDRTIENYGERSYGTITMTNVLEKSVNTGAVFAERQVGDKVFLAYLEKFGFFEITGIDLQGEVFSKNEAFKKGYEINFATASFGQGVEMTSINVLRAFSAIANGGKLVKPYVVDKIRDENGKIQQTVPEIQDEMIISPKTASQITAMLVSVVKNGYSKPAQIPGYYIAGKTGTAQVSYSALGINKAGYSDKTIQSFVGFAPAFNPKFVILVKLNNPKANTAEYSAAPIFHDLAKQIIDYYQIPPDYAE